MVENPVNNSGALLRSIKLKNDVYVWSWMFMVERSNTYKGQSIVREWIFLACYCFSFSEGEVIAATNED